MKYLFAAPDGARFEAVRIPLEHPARFSVCVSSQVGCAGGRRARSARPAGSASQRNLAAWEIVEQVRVVRARLPAGTRAHGVVFQGMGEPLANLDAVLGAIAVLSEPCGRGKDARGLTVCTSGLPQRHPPARRRRRANVRLAILDLELAIRPPTRKAA